MTKENETKPSFIDELPKLIEAARDGKPIKEQLRKHIKDAGGPAAMPEPTVVLKQLMKTYYEALLETEMDNHLGFERNGESPDGNYRNGTSPKAMRTHLGEVQLEIPRDREGEFQPIAVKKHQRSLASFDDAIISLYTRGLTTREIEAHLKDIYGVDVSPAFVSKVTDRVNEERKSWQARPLEQVYPILYMDGVRFPVNTDGRVINKVVYVAIGISLAGRPDVLGLWLAENEGAQFWLNVCNDLKSRGVEDILVACVDGLKGLPDAIKAVFHDADVQLCVVHMIRAATRFISFKDRKPFCADLKAVYSAPTLEAALMALDSLEGKWQAKYPGSVRTWRDNWTLISTFFSYPPDIRRFIYTTNKIENLNGVLRKNTRNRRVFPNDEALLKILYLNIVNFTDRWTIRQNWGTVINQLSIIFGDRITRHLNAVT